MHALPDAFPYARLARSMTGEAEACAVARVLGGASYLGMGEEVAHFEQEIAQFLGVARGRVVVVNSGTAALHLAVAAVCPPQSEVLVPSLTYVASAQAVTAAQCIPIFCDVCEHSASLDLADAAGRVSARTRAIMPMHYGGAAWQLPAVYAFAARHNLRVIEDAAHAFGCSFGGRRIGAQGDMVCFSFDGIKNITSGEGGCIVALRESGPVGDIVGDIVGDVADVTPADFCRESRALGMTSAGDSVRQGWRYHMSDICAAIGRVQLRRFSHEFAPKRRALVSCYASHLAQLHEYIRPLSQDADAFVVPHLYAIRVLHGKRDAVRAHLARHNIATGIHYRPCHEHSFYRIPYALPVAERLYGELLTLPLHPLLSEAHVAHICAKLCEALDE